MRFLNAGLQDNVVSLYDKTKTTIAGRVAQKIINSNQVLGPPLTRFIDVQTEAGLTPVGPAYCSPTGRLFIPSAVTTGLGTIALYQFDLTTGAYSYVGKISYSMPATPTTTHTMRGFKVDDTGATWKIFILTTGSVLINGGLFMLNGIVQADFIPVAFPTIPFATGSNQRAVYFLQNPASLGAAHAMTSGIGIPLDTAAKKVYVHNGAAAVHQYHVFDYSGTPDNPGLTATISVGTPAVVTANGHGYNAGDQITFTTTGTLPVGLGSGVNYFVRNPTANTFEVSTTSGGAGVNTTGAGTGTHTVRRTFGITGSFPYYATGNLPALTGTLLLTNSEDRKVPSSGPNAGQGCASFGSSTAIYEGLLSELTVGATTWPSLRTVNTIGNGLDIVAPTATFYQYSEVVDRCIYVTNTAKFVVKPFQNSVIENVFGSLSNQYLELAANPVVNFGLSAISGFEIQSGILFAVSSASGQRGILFMDFRSDYRYDYSYVISKVLTVDNAVLKFLTTLEELFDDTSPMVFFYRTSGFDSAAGGWTSIETAKDLSSIGSAAQVQFKVMFNSTNEDVSTPAQIRDLILGYEPLSMSSMNWEASRDLSSSGSPTDVVFRLKAAYTATVPALKFVATDLANAVLVSHTTTAQAANFAYSADGGTTWLPLGTIPNTVGTLVRYRFTSPPGVDIRPALKEA